MKLIFKWWNWWDGRHSRAVELRQLKDGYISKYSIRELISTLKGLEGKWISVEVEDA